MRLGLSSFAFGWAVSTPVTATTTAFTHGTLLDFAVARGVPVIQFGDNLPLHVLSDAELDALAGRARLNAVAVETGARGLTSERVQRYIAISRRLDAHCLRFVVDANDYEPAPDEIVGIIRDALPALRDAGLVLGLENHDRFPSATLRRIVDTLDSANVGVCLDTANSLGAGEGIREVLQHLASVCVNLHMKDFAVERLPYLMGFTVTGRSLGGGLLPLDETLHAVAAGGRCTTAVIELWTPPESNPAATIAKEAAWAAQSVDVLRAALRKMSAVLDRP